MAQRGLGHHGLHRPQQGGIVTTAQATLHETDRFTNIQNAFRLRDNADDLTEKNILIVDDVITTGATIETMAKILKAAGAGSIWALTIAYGHPLENKTG